jgi:hypothetical protein
LLETVFRGRELDIVLLVSPHCSSSYVSSWLAGPVFCLFGACSEPRSTDGERYLCEVRSNVLVGERGWCGLSNPLLTTLLGFPKVELGLRGPPGTT